MPEFYGKRLGNVLVPDGNESLDEFETVPRGKLLRIDVTQPRSVQHNRLYFALCRRIATGIGQTTEFVDRAFRIETGHVDVFEYGGRAHLVVRSLSFAKVDQIEFAAYFERCCQVAYERWQIPPESLADLLAPQEVQKHR